MFVSLISRTPLYIFYLICDVICIFCLCGLDDNIFMLFLECLLLGCVWNEVIVVVGVIFGRGCGCGCAVDREEVLRRA